ncbi:hypothetical protein JST97_02545 [bacterium]|nr:hypothetical protein [bacterium]
MNVAPISAGSASVSAPAVRKSSPRPVQEQPPVQPEVATGVESLSLQTKVDLSQKAQVQPPPPPQATKKKTAVADKLPSKSVEGQDFTGRTCSGTLHGPLLMEDPMALGFECESPRDFETMHRLGMQLGQVPAELLLAPAGQEALVREPDFAYFGVGPEGARLVQNLQGEPDSQPQESRIKLASGQEVLVTRGPNEISILVPPARLEELASWGRNLLAVA